MSFHQKPEQYYDITDWTPTEINEARRDGHLADLLAGIPAPVPEVTAEQENDEAPASDTDDAA
jgi:hypothetical protein